MSAKDKQRLAHLLHFERAGFRISAFHEGSALFYREVFNDYVSMAEMTERGYTPKPAIAINSQNVPVYSQSGGLIDVFVPVLNAGANFIPPVSAPVESTDVQS